MRIVAGLKYSKDHEWVKVEGNQATIGITDYAQHSLGDIVFVELPEVGDHIDKDQTFGVVESVKAASDIYLPVAGTVEKINEALNDEPELINTDAFENWLICVEMDDPTEVDDLMDATEYEAFCQE
ncbi:glycine cleavage system protein GcvH [Acetobacterium sp. UBA5834]|jgi:glycine cleavage system H protein|uniref:glycine cleavage system protein GcvH n=1 Tax=Acetobacterium sp. UBA5834 TaxID=1945907 RepID=UPI00257F76F2|nr:glycine cleavage system protein GcvH [Acetobacterium sp. UBA5834]